MTIVLIQAIISVYQRTPCNICPHLSRSDPLSSLAPRLLKIIFTLQGSGCGSVGRAVASDTWDLRFNDSNWQLLFSVNCLYCYDENKEKWGWEWPNKKSFLNCHHQIIIFYPPPFLSIWLELLSLYFSIRPHQLYFFLWWKCPSLHVCQMWKNIDSILIESLWFLESLI